MPGLMRIDGPVYGYPINRGARHGSRHPLPARLSSLTPANWHQSLGYSDQCREVASAIFVAEEDGFSVQLKCRNSWNPNGLAVGGPAGKGQFHYTICRQRRENPTGAIHRFIHPNRINSLGHRARSAPATALGGDGADEDTLSPGQDLLLAQLFDGEPKGGGNEGGQEENSQ